MSWMKDTCSNRERSDDLPWHTNISLLLGVCVVILSYRLRSNSPRGV